MAKTENVVHTGGIGFCGLLAILFIALKLLNLSVVATWSWLWVLSPLWLPLAFLLVIAVIVLGFAGICMLIASKS